MKRFNVVIPKEDGGVEIHRMKEWLRQHPEYLPSGCDPTLNNSHSLRDALKKTGWTVQVTQTEERLFLPGAEEDESSVDDLLGPGDEDENEVEETSFALEYRLRDFIAQDISAIPIDGRTLHLYVDPAGQDGIEFPTAVGPIDILAVDESNAFVVFELKRARSPDHAIGQLARYMGWVKQTIGRNVEVRGVIVAKTITNNLRYAVHAIPNVSLFEYQINFQLNPAQGVVS